MPTEAIVGTLLRAAAFLKKPIQEVMSKSIKDAYEAVKNHLQRKFGEGSAAANALELATDKPDSAAREALLIEESASAGLETDAELTQLVNQLAALLPESGGGIRQYVRVGGHGNKVLVAGRDVVHATRHVQRNIITPDERHLTTEQRERLRKIVREVAGSIAMDDTGPNYAVVYRMLQRRFNVVSYALIAHGQYEEALGFLKQQRAIRRSGLRRRNPVAYERDFFRAIFSRATELGWDRPRVYEFAAEKLGLKKQVTSLKQLGANQLKSLAEYMRCETRKNSAVAVASHARQQ